jgi:cholesterol oxidase
LDPTNNAGTGGPCGHFVFENPNNPFSPSDAVELVVPKPQAFPGSSLYVGLGLAPAAGQFTYDITTDSCTLQWPRGESQLQPAEMGAASFEQVLNSKNPGSFDAFSSVDTPPDLTAHPVGGATMGRVCDTYGQVKNYAGLYVVDGAIVPGGSVGGVNPSFTIAALAERSMDRIVSNIMNNVEDDARAGRVRG